MGRRDDTTDIAFLWASVTQLEDRISTVDTKANILTGIAIAIVAVSGSLAATAIDEGTALALKIAVAVATSITFVLAAGVVLLCLRLLNPRKSSPEHAEGFKYPQPYVLWPRSGQPWSRGAEAHVEALESLTEVSILSNLRAMQTTLLFLVDAKYRYYRRSVEWTRCLVLFELPMSALAVATMAS